MKRNLTCRGTLIALIVGMGASAAKAQTITEFTISTINGSPSGIAAGPDGNLWFTENQGNKIGRMTPSGSITEFPIPTPGSGAGAIAAAADGSLWFTEGLSNQIGRITTEGVITEFPILPAGTPPFHPRGITAGPDGNLWFAEGSVAITPFYSKGRIGRITTSGVITEFPIPSTGNGARGIAAGPDGNLWFTTAKEIGRITTSGAITEVAAGGAGGIAAGPDGNLWFARGAGIGRITAAGVVDEFAIPSGGSGGGIAAGPDGNLWFTESAANRIGRITPAGVVTEFAIPTASSFPSGIAAGPDGDLWFTEYSGNNIGRITTTGWIVTCVRDQESLCLSGGRFQATATYRNASGSGTARASGISDSSGLFTFDNPDSVELVVKVLNACSFTPNIWVFAAGLTDQEVFLTVTDTKTGDVRTYANPLGTKFVSETDTAAFSTCP